MRTGVPPSLARMHLIAAILATLLGVLGLWLKGPTPIVRGMIPQDTAVPVTYMVAAFPFFGILLADLWLFVGSGSRRQAMVLGGQLLAALSVARLGLLIPISGHVLLIVFFVLWTAGQPPCLVRRVEWWLAWIALAVFASVKLFVWSDWLSLLTGAAIGVLVWWAGRRIG